LTQDGHEMWRPAAFVYDVPGGIAWVEPSYADPYGAASPALHVRRGERTAATRFEGPGFKVEVIAYTPGLDADLVGDALEWYAGWLTAEGRTWHDERERVRAMIEADL